MRPEALILTGILSLSGWALAADAGGISAGGPAARKDTTCVDDQGINVLDVWTTRFGGDTRLVALIDADNKRLTFKVNKIPLKIAGKWALYARDDQNFSLLINENDPAAESQNQFHAALTVRIDGQITSRKAIICTIPIIGGGA